MPNTDFDAHRARAWIRSRPVKTASRRLSTVPSSSLVSTPTNERAVLIWPLCWPACDRGFSDQIRYEKNTRPIRLKVAGESVCFESSSHRPVPPSRGRTFAPMRDLPPPAARMATRRQILDLPSAPTAGIRFPCVPRSVPAVDALWTADRRRHRFEKAAELSIADVRG